MTLRFNVLGFEVANIQLDVGEFSILPRELTVLDKGIKGITRIWVKHMNR